MMVVVAFVAGMIAGALGVAIVWLRSLPGTQPKWPTDIEEPVFYNGIPFERSATR